MPSAWPIHFNQPASTPILQLIIPSLNTITNNLNLDLFFFFELLQSQCSVTPLPDLFSAPTSDWSLPVRSPLHPSEWVRAIRVLLVPVVWLQGEIPIHQLRAFVILPSNG
jgi:hypothetical protein